MTAGEAAAVGGAWTTETALAHVLGLLEAYDRRYEQRFASEQKAVEVGLEAQKDVVRAALIAADRAVAAAVEDQQRLFMPRAEAAALIGSQERAIEDLRRQLSAFIVAARAERAGIKGGWGYAVGAVGFLASLVALGILLAQALGRAP